MSSIDLVVSQPISGSLQPVTAQSGGSPAGLQIATNQTLITGQDIVGLAMPFCVAAQSTSQPTQNRIMRLESPTGMFYDLGIDSSGNLFINSQQASGILKLSPTGLLTVPKLAISNLQAAPGGSVDLVVDSSGNVYTQS